VDDLALEQSEAAQRDRVRAPAGFGKIGLQLLEEAHSGHIIATSMTPLAVGPILALLGVVAAFYVMRGRAKTRKSMYRTLRERREGELRKARERATAANRASEQTELDRQTTKQAAAKPA